MLGDYSLALIITMRAMQLGGKFTITRLKLDFAAKVIR